jgi:tryptophan synthase beta chain
MATCIESVTLDQLRFNQSQIPTQWFNVIPFLPEPLPPVIDPDDGKESRISLMKKIRLRTLVEQDSMREPFLDIPEEVLQHYEGIGRPTPLTRAKSLEDYLQTPARIYFKREDVLPTASFKLNSAIAQAYYAKKEGAEGLVSETGAGQWGHALAYACNLYGLKCVIFWVKVSLGQKPQRAMLTKMLGARVYLSPGDHTPAGREILGKYADNPGSLGTSIAEAISYASTSPSMRYVSGSNLPHVLLHQTVIGQEARVQLAQLDETPDALVACVGGGSNLGGFMNPFLPLKLESKDGLRFVAAESDAAPRLTRGEYRYDHADPVGLTPLTLSYTLGMNYIPPPVHVGGLRQHSGSPIIGVLRRAKILEAYSYSQEDVLKAGRTLIERERIIPAPESCHAVKAVIDLALEAKRLREKKVIVACLSGSGLLDLQAYQEALGSVANRKNESERI